MKKLSFTLFVFMLAALFAFGGVAQVVQAYAPPQIQADVNASVQQQEVTPPIVVTADVDITTTDNNDGGINTTWLIIIIVVVLILLVGIALGTGRTVVHHDD